MAVSGSLVTLRGAELARLCRTSIRPVVQTDGWWRELWHPEPVVIHAQHGERVLIASRHHWIVPLKNLATMSVEMIVMTIVSLVVSALPISSAWFQTVLWICALGHTTWMSRHLLTWRADVMIVTNWRFIRTGGIVTTGFKTYKFASVGNFYRSNSLVGRILGYSNVRIVQNGGPHNIGADDEYCPYVPRTVARVLDHCSSQPLTV